MDDVDRAQEREEHQREEALAKMHKRAQEAGVSYSHCEDCGDPIPELRRQIVKGCTRCVLCEELTERQGKR
jgi:phage/conjugal plasmid C-4 type zinc finger TraR family protein